MTDPRTDEADEPLDEAALAELLRSAGPRPAVDPRRLEQVKAAVRPAWRQSVEGRTSTSNPPKPRPSRRRSTLRWVLPLAAVLALAVVSRWQPWSPPAAAAPLATVEKVLGEGIEILQATRSQPLTLGTQLLPGDTVVSGGGALALRMADGTALRLDSDSRLRLLAAGRVELLDGGVYVDTHPEGPPPADATPPGGLLTIETRWGTATDVGTQFEVRLDSERLRIRVREGRVDLTRSDGRHPIEAGQQLEIDSGGGPSWSEVASHGEPWAWVVELAPPFQLEGQSVADFLAWVARETGARIHWADPELAVTAAGATAHGSLEGLDPVTALEVVPPASGLAAELVDGELRVDAAKSP